MAIATILVIEDNPREQYLLKELLKNFDYDAHVVSSGEEALEAWKSFKFAAVLMDVMLPGMDGYECTWRIREMEQRVIGGHVPIIALTARGEVKDKEDCLRAGMDEYMSKPFEPEELRKIILRWVYLPAHPNLKILPASVEFVKSST